VFSVRVNLYFKIVNGVLSRHARDYPKDVCPENENVNEGKSASIIHRYQKFCTVLSVNEAIVLGTIEI
jgi:hypothetical protein